MTLCVLSWLQEPHRISDVADQIRALRLRKWGHLIASIFLLLAAQITIMVI